MELHSVCSVNWQTCAPYTSNNASDCLDAVVKHLALVLGVAKALPKIVALAVCLAASAALILLDVFILNRSK